MMVTSKVKLPNRIRSVAFTCDVLRFSSTQGGIRIDQTGNLRWLKEVITAAPAWADPELELTTVLAPEGAAEFAAALGNAHALAEYRDDSELAWARRFDQETPSVFARLFDDFLRHDLVIGYELPPTIKRHLHRHGRPYLSFHVHALRFLRDLCLAASTNCAALAKALELHAVPEASVRSQVRRFRAQFSRLAAPAFALPRGVPLLIGQTERDSVLIEAGRFCSFADKQAALEDLLRPHDSVVLIEHPLRPCSAEIAQFLRARCGKNVIATNANGYGILLSNLDAPLALTLASSLGAEAQCLGIPTEFLLQDPRLRLLLPGVDVGTSLPLGHGVLQDALWAPLLQRQARRSTAAGADFGAFQLGDNYLRTSLMAWSYQLLESGPEGARSRKVLLPAPALAELRREQLLKALAGDDPSAGPISGWDRDSLQVRGVDLVIGEAPFEPGERRRIALDDPWSASSLHGFHAPESWGAWSSQLRAGIQLVVSWHAVELSAKLRVTLSIHVHERLLAACPVLRIANAGMPLAYVFFRPQGPLSGAVSFELPCRSTLCAIDLELTNIDSPFGPDEVKDNRLLGIGLTSIDVECVASDDCEAGTTGIGQACRAWGIGSKPTIIDDDPCTGEAAV